MKLSRAAALLPLVVLGACGSGEGSGETATVGGPANGGTYAEVSGLRDAAVDAGLDCQAWELTSNPTSDLIGSGSGSCSSSAMLTIYEEGIPPQGMESVVDSLQEAGAGYSFLVGENWVIISPDAEDLQDHLGGKLIFKDAAPLNQPEPACPRAEEVTAAMQLSGEVQVYPETNDGSPVCTYLYSEGATVMMGINADGYAALVRLSEGFLGPGDRLKKLEGVGDEAFVLAPDDQASAPRTAIGVREGGLAFSVSVLGVDASRATAVRLFELLRDSDVRPS